MQTSHFQLGLIATLAVGLGFALASSDAVGYPAGAVSMGSNPVWSVGGHMGGGSHVVATAEAGDLIVTDISITSDNSEWWGVDFVLTDGSIVASFRAKHLHDREFSRAFMSGIRVPQGDSLTINWGAYYGAHTNYRYTLSGYYAQP